MLPPDRWIKCLKHSIATATTTDIQLNSIGLLEPAATRAIGGKICIFTGEAGHGMLQNLCAITEFEYAERDGYILVPRLQKKVDLDERILLESIGFATEDYVVTELFHQPNCRLKMRVGIPSQPQLVVFEHDHHQHEVSKEEVHGDDILSWNLKHLGLTSATAWRCMRPSENRGPLECSGFITQAGRLAASHGYAPRDSIFCLAEWPLSNRVWTRWTSATHTPSKLSFAEAATLSVAFTTATIGLCYLGLFAERSISAHPRCSYSRRTSGVDDGAPHWRYHFAANEVLG